MAASDAKIEKLEAERKVLDEAKKKATETVNSDSASAADKAKAQASKNAIEKREKRLDEGKNFSIRNLSRAKKSVSALKLNKVNSQYKMDKLKLQKESLAQDGPKKSFLSKMAKKTNKEIASQQALKQSFKNLKDTKRNKQLDILKAKSNKEGVALSLSQAQTRARLQYNKNNKNNPGMGISKERYRGIQREKAKQGQADLNKYAKMKPTNLSKSQQARMKVLEDGKFFGTNSVKKLTKKTETRNEKTNRLSKEREKLIEKAKNPQQNFSKNNSKRLSRLQDGTLFKKSVLERQGKSINNRKLDRMKTKKNIMDTGQQPRTKKDTEKMEKLGTNIGRLQTKKNNRTQKLKFNKQLEQAYLTKSKTQELSKPDKAQLSKLQYGIGKREGKNKTVRNKEASAARLGALEARYSKGNRLSLNNTRKLYRDSGSNFRERQEKDLARLTKRKEKGDFTKPSYQKKFERLQKQLSKYTKTNKLNRNINHKEKEVDALKAQQQLGVMGQESSTRQKELNIQLNGLRKIQAKRNVKAIGREAVRDLERQRLLEQEQEQEQEQTEA